jgi:hypothetical protein
MRVRVIEQELVPFQLQVAELTEKEYSKFKQNGGSTLKIAATTMVGGRGVI